MTTSRYIAVEGGEKNRYSPDKRYKLLRKGTAEGLTPVVGL